MITHNIKVGLAVIIAAVILVVTLSFVGGERFTKKNTYKLTVVFDNVQGLSPGAKVWLSGVEIGKVEEVALRPDGKAELRLLVGKEYPIIRGAEFTIKVGFLQDTILSIKQPEISPAKKTFYEDEDVITKTSAPATLDDLVGQANTAMSHVNDMLMSVKEIVGNDTMKQNILETVENINKTTLESYEFAKMLRETGFENKDNIDATIYNIRELTASLNETAEKVDLLMTHANDIAGDPQFKSDIKRAVSTMNQTLDNLNATSEKIKQLVTDQEVEQDLRQTIKSTRKTMENADVALGGFTKMIKTVNETEVKPSFEFRYDARENKFHADMNLRMYPPDPKVSYMVGLDDLGENSSSNLMLGVLGGQPDLWYRVGIKSGKLGIGADWDRGDYYYEGDLVDPNDLRCSLRVGKKLNKNSYVLGGWESILKKNGISFGFLQKY